MADDSTPIAPDEVLGAPSGPRTRPAGRARRPRRRESVNEPAKVLRIGSMVKTLLEEVRQAPLDEKSRTRLREIYEQSIHDLSEGLSPDLVAELDRMALPFDDRRPASPSCASPRPNWWAGWRGCSTGSRPRSCPSRWRPGPSSRRCASAGCPRRAESSTSRPGAYL